MTMKRSIHALTLTKDIALLLVSLLAVAICLREIQITITPDRDAELCDCGDSVAAARAQGCQYDTLAAAWLPLHCIDKDLVAEFDASGDGPGGQWQYWADANHTRELTVDEVGALADTPGRMFYTTARWHFMHCFFYWRKLQRARTTGVRIERRYDNERHVKHCGKMFEDPGETAFSYVELKSSNTEPPEFVRGQE